VATAVFGCHAGTKPSDARRAPREHGTTMEERTFSAA